MATRSLTTISEDSNVIQELHWDTISKKIEVVHMMNLEAGINARWKILLQEMPGSVNYDRLCRTYGITPPKNAIVTVFEYDEFDDPAFSTPHAEKFPVSGDYYSFSGLPHLVYAKLNKKAAGETSVTSGQAIPT